MSLRRRSFLKGVIQLVTGVDSIGVPIFMADNSMYVPEMDGDFRIANFMEFYNEHGFSITYDLPAAYNLKKFSIKDPAPIPFWINGKCHIIEGDAEKTQPEKLFGTQARTNDVLLDLTRLLDDARSGRIQAIFDEWNAEKLVSAYGEVFLEPPSRTKYWVSKYRVALKAARKLAKPPHPIDVRLRNASSEWLEKFGSKSDFGMLSGILGDAASGVYSLEQIRGILFAYIANKIHSSMHRDIQVIQRDHTVRSFFPDGIYQYYLSNGWPHVPFKYSRPDFNAFMNTQIYSANRTGDYKPAVALAHVLYGGSNAPIQVDDVAVSCIRGHLEELRVIQDLLDRRKYPEDGSNLQSISQEYLTEFDAISKLSQICHGEDRKRGEIGDGRFGISLSERETVRLYALEEGYEMATSYRPRR